MVQVPDHLPRHGLFKLPDGAGWQIECVTGALWITLDCDSCDFVLGPGQCFVTEERRPVIVYALKASDLRVGGGR